MNDRIVFQHEYDGSSQYRICPAHALQRDYSQLWAKFMDSAEALTLR